MKRKYSNPWKKLSSRLVYENPWIKVREDSVICPDGSTSIYGVVEASLAVGVVAVDDRRDHENIYLVGQWRYPLDQYSWEIIEGGLEEGESPEDTAVRELKEEAGIVAGRLEVLVEKVHLSNCYSNEQGIIFLAKDIVVGEAQPEATEDITVKKISVSEAYNLVLNGAITDALSIIGITRYIEKTGNRY